MHILFLVGLLLPCGTRTTLAKIVTAFTLGHTLTLSLAVLGVLSPSARVIEPAIALSIVFAWVALVFGLVHGFGFAISFNLGVELGQQSSFCWW
jgi:FtsH-binding integral membrane protein